MIGFYYSSKLVNFRPILIPFLNFLSQKKTYPVDFQDQRLFETEVIKEKAYLKYQDLRILYTIPRHYLILCDALYFNILFYIHDDISLLRLWNQDLPYIYNSLFFFLCFHLLVYLQLLLYLFQHQISHSCRARAIYLWNFFNYKINILVPELHLACLSMEWCWNEEKLSIQLLL